MEISWKLDRDFMEIWWKFKTMNLKKYQKISINFIVVFLFLFLLAPVLAIAAESDVACKEYSYPWCGQGAPQDIAQFIKQFYTYALAAVGVAALGAIIYGGVMYAVSAGNASRQQEAISWITGAVWGLVLLLGANLLLRTINPELKKLKLETLKEVKIEAPENKPYQRTGEAFKDTTVVQRGDVNITVPILGTDKTMTIPIRNFNVKEGASIVGTKSSTLAEVAYLQNEGATSNKFNSDNIVITSGTDGSHESGKYSHGTGYKVDLRSNNKPQLNSYIESVPNGWKKLERKDGGCFTDKCYQSPRGAIYNFEGDHWDILVKP